MKLFIVAVLVSLIAMIHCQDLPTAEQIRCAVEAAEALSGDEQLAYQRDCQGVTLGSVSQCHIYL